MATKKSLRSALVLRKEINSGTRKRTRSAFDTQMKGAIAAIEKAQASRLTNCTVLSLPEAVVRALRKQNYKVTFWSAAGMGDMDSHHIEW